MLKYIKFTSFLLSTGSKWSSTRKGQENEIRDAGRDVFSKIAIAGGMSVVPRENNFSRLMKLSICVFNQAIK